jgi:hypothetical protein
MSFSLSTTVVSPEGEQLYTFEYAAFVTETSYEKIQANTNFNPRAQLEEIKL